MAEAEQSGVMSLTVSLLSAYFANNTVPSSELPALVEGTRRALLGDAAVAAASDTKAQPAAPAEPDPEESGKQDATPEPAFRPAVSIEASLASPDQILSLIDGKPYKALKRHLTTNGLSPAEYRARYGLPADYPMVAPAYSEARRAVAKKLGLGGKRKTAIAAGTSEPAAEPVVASIPSPEPVGGNTKKPAPARKAGAKSKSPATTAPGKTKPSAKAAKVEASAAGNPETLPPGDVATAPKAAPARQARSKIKSAATAPKKANVKAEGATSKPITAKPKRAHGPETDALPATETATPGARTDTAAVDSATAEAQPAE